MTADNQEQALEWKAGPMTTPGGLLGGGNAASTPQAINATAQVMGPYRNGAYTIEGDVAFYYLTGTAAVLQALTAAEIARLGVRVPARSEAVFNADYAQDYIAWVRVDTDGVDFRVNDRSRGKIA